MRLFYAVLLFAAFLLSLLAGHSAQGQERDSITIAIEPGYNEVSASHRFWLGENYRKLWATPVKMRVLRLGSEKGGLSVVKTGGGMQTRSLRLKDASGREWVLRTIQKYPERGLPENLRPTIARDILQDQVSTGHPYGAQVVPLLADALKLPHASPEVVYVADDPGLGEYRKDFANAVYLFEERMPDDADKTDNTEKVIRKLAKDNDVKVEQKLVLRARLLDFLVGDWDRHDDNWRWLPGKEKKETSYTPVPRDRDKVFYKTTGVFPWILSHQWLKSNLQPYQEKIRDIKGWNYNARYFDRYFLNALNEDDWIEEIRYVQNTITDGLISRAMRQMPDTIYRQNGHELERVMKGRRDRLAESALEYYRFISIYTDVPLSASSEIVEVDQQSEHQLAVTVYNRKKDGSKGRLLYSRTFRPDITSEVRIYGMAGNDQFLVNGKAKPKIKVRLIGGDEKDDYAVSDEVKNRSRIFIYDQPGRENNLPPRAMARLRLSSDTSVNSYNRTAFKYDRFGPMALVNYNIDQGIQLRAGMIYEKQGFRKEPFAVKHEFWANYSTGRNSYIFNYDGRFTGVIGKNDLSVDLDSWGPNNVTNFFGLGNQTEFKRHDEGGINYYRNYFDYLTGSVRLNRSVARNLRVNAGLGAEFYTSDHRDNISRFFRSFDLSNPSERVFEDRFYAGLVGGAQYDTRNNSSNPSSGVLWNAHITAKRQLNGTHDQYARIESDLSFYLNAGDEALIIANRVGGGTTLGDPAFFQRMQLGGVRTMRGFHTNRFTGKTMAYHNLDLRMRLFHFTSYLLPGTVGLIGFHDTGRVWLPGEKSEKWHHGYGGGLYIIPAELILIQGTVGFSREGSLPYISIGYSF